MEQHEAWDDETARALIAELAPLHGATLPILHALQNHFGYVDRAAVKLIADALNLSQAEIHGVISFYHDFRDASPGGRVISLCVAEACQAVGCEALVAHASGLAGVSVDAPALHGEVLIQTVYCLGNCALGPSALVEGELIGRLDVTRLAALCAGGAAA
jgi:formate dehydrogenase subunit gamma